MPPVDTESDFRFMFGPVDGPAWFAEGLSWQQARSRQREFFIRTFGSERGGRWWRCGFPTQVARMAFVEILTAENAMLKAQVERNEAMKLVADWLESRQRRHDAASSSN